jgi:hypothetical protein
MKSKGNNNVHFLGIPVNQFQIPPKLVKTQRLMENLQTKKNTQHRGHPHEI